MIATLQSAMPSELPAGLHGVKPGVPVVLDENGNADKDQLFEHMISAYRDSGGMVSGERFEQMIKGRHRGDFFSLERIVISGEIFSFEWSATLWIPMFQFEPLDLYIMPGPRQVLSVLDRVFDNWALALWFVQPNSWLHGRLPVDMIHNDTSAVLHAARADRFIAEG